MLAWAPMVAAGTAAVTRIWPCVDVAHICATIIKHRNRKGKHTMSTNTVTLHRVLRAPPERIYRAFLEPAAMAKWLPPYGFTCDVLHMDARVGGSYKMAFTNFGNGRGNSFGGDYLELVPGSRICYTAQFDDPNLPGTMKTTVTLSALWCAAPTWPSRRRASPR
jgi:hypothetical protein